LKPADVYIHSPQVHKVIEDTHSGNLD